MRNEHDMAMKRIAGYALLVLGWLSIIGGALVIGATLGALLWIHELGRPIGLLWSAAIGGFAFLGGGSPNRYASQSDFAIALATRAGVVVLAVSLLVEAWPKRNARAEAAPTQQDLPSPPAGLTRM